MTDADKKAERKVAEGAMKEAIGMIAGDAAAESAGARDKVAGERDVEAERKRKARSDGRH